MLHFTFLFSAADTFLNTAQLLFFDSFSAFCLYSFALLQLINENSNDCIIKIYCLLSVLCTRERERLTVPRYLKRNTSVL